ncbi:MAG TPA: DUF1971 domain-containing protein [Solimonas sp.]
MKPLPADVVPYKRTPDFTEQTVPPALLREHRTKEAVWGRIVVLEGRLQYTINEPECEVHVLDTEHFGVVEPTVRHEVKPLGKVRFYVEFNR